MSASATLSAVVARRHGSAGAAGGLGRAARRARSARSRTPLTLTRRGRLVFLGLPVLAGSAALVVLAVIFLVPSTATATSEPVLGSGTEQTTVFPGQSLWELAVTADPDRDPREVMDEIVELNDLDSSVLVAGQLLEVPAA
ncbi:LysM peptidoglycan-binding domain-containing protein [Kocuria sp. M4R2S49]|uniref:LysM peptidoglycan-binding domain-containing protein n=1 Tax=Kocuria rhizosphaericola TaxID=3376284 RepID=UPI0037B28764